MGSRVNSFSVSERGERGRGAPPSDSLPAGTDIGGTVALPGGAEASFLLSLSRPPGECVCVVFSSHENLAVTYRAVLAATSCG